MLYAFTNTFLSGRGLGQSKIAQAAYNLVTSKIKTSFVEINEHKMFLDKNDSMSLSINRWYEPYQTNLAAKYIKTGDTVLDLGANIGYYTLLFAKLVGSTGMVYAFEPEKTNFDVLLKNCALNGYQNVVAENKAISDTNTPLTFYLSKDNSGDNRLFGDETSEKAVSVPAVKLDDYFSNANLPINFIKMDIQGAEGRAFQGMKTLMSKTNRLVVFCEFWPYGLAKTGQDPEAFLQLVANYGFTIKEISEKVKSTLNISVEQLLKMHTVENKKFTNLLLEKI